MLLRTYRSPWSPWREMQRMRREMNRLLSTMPEEIEDGGARAYPATNVWTNEAGAIVTAELPGVDPEAIDISVVDNTLTISGSREPDVLKEGEIYHRRERGSGKFARSLRLPFNVEPGKVDAVFENGVLQISLPRAEEEKPKKIAVKAA